MAAGTQWKNPKGEINGNRHTLKLGMNRARDRKFLIDDLYFVIPESKMRIIQVTSAHDSMFCVHRGRADFFYVVALYEHSTALRKSIFCQTLLCLKIESY